MTQAATQYKCSKVDLSASGWVGTGRFVQRGIADQAPVGAVTFRVVLLTSAGHPSHRRRVAAGVELVSVGTGRRPPLHRLRHVSSIASGGCSAGFGAGRAVISGNPAAATGGRGWTGRQHGSAPGQIVLISGIYGCGEDAGHTGRSPPTSGCPPTGRLTSGWVLDQWGQSPASLLNISRRVRLVQPSTHDGGDRGGRCLTARRR